MGSESKFTILLSERIFVDWRTKTEFSYGAKSCTTNCNFYLTNIMVIREELVCIKILEPLSISLTVYFIAI